MPRHYIQTGTYNSKLISSSFLIPNQTTGFSTWPSKDRAPLAWTAGIKNSTSARAGVRKKKNYLIIQDRQSSIYKITNPSWVLRKFYDLALSHIKDFKIISQSWLWSKPCFSYIGSAALIMFLNFNLSRAICLDTLNFFKTIFIISSHVFFNLPLVFGGPSICTVELLNNIKVKIVEKWLSCSKSYKQN